MEKKRNILNLSDEFIASLTKMESYKLPLIFIGNVVFAFAFLGLGCFLLYEALSFPEYLPVGILCLATCIIYTSSIILLKKEKLKTSALVSSIGILFACMMIVCVCPPSEQPLVYYRSGCFVAVMAVCNQVVALKRRQIHIFNCAIAVLWVIMIIRTVPYTRYDMVATISSIGINTLGDFIAILLISSLNRFNLVTLEGEIAAQQTAEKNLESITTVIEESKNGLSVGQKLVDETQRAGANISQMNNLYAGITRDANSLSGSAESVSLSSSDVLHQAEKMQSTISQQNTLINETSSALLEISGNISNLSVMAEQRGTNMKDMIGTLADEKKLIKQIVNEVKQVQESSDGIAGFVKTVNTIASQTNLLAMNASIEAAHAGSVGKGFSVIAHEIRKLSEQTSKNAAQITDELSKNTEIVLSTAKSVESFDQYIQKTTVEMESTIEMIEQLLEGIQSIDNENSHVMESLKDVVSQSNETNLLAGNVVSEINTQDKTLNEMRSLAEGLKKNVDAMNIQLQDFQTVIQTIDKEAVKNIEVSQNITSCLN